MFEIGFHVLHREIISCPNAKIIVKLLRLDSARLQIILVLNSLDVWYGPSNVIRARKLPRLFKEKKNVGAS
jgi:hypothetical protein